MGFLKGNLGVQISKCPYATRFHHMAKISPRQPRTRVWEDFPGMKWGYLFMPRSILYPVVVHE